MSGSRGPALLLSGPGALCAGDRRSLCRAPALFVSGPALFLSGSGAMVCLEPGLFLYRSSALFSALSVGAQRPPAVSRPEASSVRSVSGPGALCVGARRSPLLVSWRGALCRESRHRGPAILSQDSLRHVRGQRSSPGALCVGARRSVSGPGALCRRPALLLCVWARRSVSGPGALCAGSVSGPGALSVRDRAPALFVSRPGALSIGLRRSLSWCVWSPDCFCIGARCSSALFVSGPSALRRSLCVRSRRSVSACVSGPGFPGAVSVRLRLRRSLCQGPALCVGRSVLGPIRPNGPSLRSDPPIRVPSDPPPPIRPAKPPIRHCPLYPIPAEFSGIVGKFVWQAVLTQMSEGML